jgi:acetylornithine deacetylase
MSDTVEILKTLIAFDTISRRSNLALVGWIVSLLERYNARIRLSHDDAGTKANVLASFGPQVAGGVVLSGHLDVVPVDDQVWSSDPFVLTERNRRLYGRGTADMKGFVAACLAAVPRIAEASLMRPIHLALSYDEEVGCLGVPRLVADLVAHEHAPAFAVIGEPTGMRIGDRHRGFFGFRTAFEGRAAHSSDPRAGASAIYPASAFVTFLNAISEDRKGDTTTFNVGRIEGGSAINIVPSACHVVWEFRPSASLDISALTTTIDSYLVRSTSSGVRHRTEMLARVPPLRPEASAFRAVQSLGGRVPPLPIAFGTEAGFFQEAGIPAVVCGPGSIEQAHQPDEWIATEQLERADAFVARVTDWAATHIEKDGGS